MGERPLRRQEADHALISRGLAWIGAEARREFGQEFAALTDEQHRQVCGPSCYAPAAPAAFAEAARLFARFRDLTALGFYTTPAGTKG